MTVDRKISADGIGLFPVVCLQSSVDDVGGIQ